MSPRRFTYGLLSVGALICAGAISSARAADLDYGYGGSDLPPAPVIAEQKVEFGTGWYVRGDIGATSLPRLGTSDAVLGEAPIITTDGARKLGYTAGLGAGYSFNRYFRSDVTVDFRMPVRSAFDSSGVFCPTGIYYITNADGSTTRKFDDGGCTGHMSGKLDSFDALVNGYVDLGTWYNVTPYVGAGIGLSFGHYATAATYTQFDGSAYDVKITDPATGAVFHNRYNHSASGNYYNFAYAFMAGFAVGIFDHTKLDIGYRYLHLGKVGNVDLDAHEARAGLRYMIDN